MVPLSLKYLEITQLNLLQANKEILIKVHRRSLCSWIAEWFAGNDDLLYWLENKRREIILSKVQLSSNGQEVRTKTADSGNETFELMADMQLVKQNNTRLQQKLNFIRQVTDKCVLIGQENVPTALLDTILNINTQEQARHIVQQLQVEGEIK